LKDYVDGITLYHRLWLLESQEDNLALAGFVTDKKSSRVSSGSIESELQESQNSAVRIQM
jgi:hypothetical protein